MAEATHDKTARRPFLWLPMKRIEDQVRNER